MKTRVLLKKLYMDGREFVTAGELKKYCKCMGLDYNTSIRHFLSRGYLVRVFRGIFYVRSLEEVELNRSKFTPMELVAEGLRIKGVKNWYFGLYSALKLNNLTPEYFAVEHVINDRIFRRNPITVAGHKFKFWKIKSILMSFGVIGDKVRYSDPEKTILDFIYLWRARGTPEEKIVMDVSEWAKNISTKKALSYTKNYPKTVRRILERVTV